MKPFSLDLSMRATLGGATYPPGYSMVCFAKMEGATSVGQRSINGGTNRENI